MIGANLKIYTEFVCFMYRRWENSFITCLRMCEFSLVYRPMHCIVIMTLVLAQPLTETCTRNISWGGG
jgi:hypothetical protein